MHRNLLFLAATACGGGSQPLFPQGFCELPEGEPIPTDEAVLGPWSPNEAFAEAQRLFESIDVEWGQGSSPAGEVFSLELADPGTPTLHTGGGDHVDACPEVVSWVEVPVTVTASWREDTALGSTSGVLVLHEDGRLWPRFELEPIDVPPEYVAFVEEDAPGSTVESWYLRTRINPYWMEDRSILIGAQFAENHTGTSHMCSEGVTRPPCLDTPYVDMTADTGR